MLGMGKDSILSKNVKKDDQDILDISINFQTMKHPGLILISAAYKKNDPDSMKNKIMEEIKKVAAGDFTMSDMNRAKTMLSNSFIFSNETNSGLAGTLGYYEVLHTYKDALNYIDSINGVSKESIAAAAEKMAAGADCTLIVKSKEKKTR